MRTGFSTSACAAAAAAAAVLALVRQEELSTITIDLPAVKGVTFPLARCEMGIGTVCCGVVKDAGDDPDATDGLEIQACVRRANHPGIALLGGKGVGRATLPGLPVEVGQAAINPGPRRLITRVVASQVEQLGLEPETGFEITIQAPEGERAAAATMNPRLGIVGGISILGTDGLVRPYSAPAFRTSLFYGLRVARENAFTTIGIATGKRSTAYLQEALRDSSGVGVLDAGDELGYPIDQAVKLGFRRIVTAGMIGKISKLAQGRFQTHVKEGEVDFDFLAGLAAVRGASGALCRQVSQARTAHQVQNLLRTEDISLEPLLAERAAEQVFRRCGGKLDVEVRLYSLQGDLLGMASKETKDDL